MWQRPAAQGTRKLAPSESSDWTGRGEGSAGGFPGVYSGALVDSSGQRDRAGQGGGRGGRGGEARAGWPSPGGGGRARTGRAERAGKGKLTSTREASGGDTGSARCGNGRQRRGRGSWRRAKVPIGRGGARAAQAASPARVDGDQGEAEIGRTRRMTERRLGRHARMCRTNAFSSGNSIGILKQRPRTPPGDPRSTTSSGRKRSFLAYCTVGQKTLFLPKRRSGETLPGGGGVGKL